MTAVPLDVLAFCGCAVRLGKQTRTVVRVPPVPVARGGLVRAGGMHVRTIGGSPGDTHHRWKGRGGGAASRGCYSGSSRAT